MIIYTDIRRDTNKMIGHICVDHNVKSHYTDYTQTEIKIQPLNHKSSSLTIYWANGAGNMN